MALKQDIIDAPKRSGVGASAKRIAVVVLALALAGASLGLRFMTKAPPGKSREAGAKADEDLAQLLPDHEGPRSLEIGPSSAQAGPSAEPSASAPLEVPPGEGPLGVTHVSSVPTGAAAGGVQNASAKLMEKQEEQMIEHLLKVQKQQLELLQKAMVAPSRVQEYAAAAADETERSAQLLSGLGASDLVKGEGADEALGPLQDLQTMRRLARSAGGPMVVGRGAHAELASAEPEGRDPVADKRGFFARGGEQLVPGRHPHTVQHPKSPYELRMGTAIPGVLVTGMSSEAPGQVLGQVTEDVYDSLAHERVLIPQGSQVVGTYSASIAQGQSRVQVAWVRLNFPNGTTLDLDGMSGADQQGVAGFHDQVNRHFLKRFAAALMSSAFTVGLKLNQPPGVNRLADAVHQGVGENVVQLGVEMAREQGRIPPTLEIRPGYRFRIMVSKDIGFAAPYPRPTVARRGRR